MSVQVFFRLEHFGSHIGQAIDMSQQRGLVFLAELFQQALIALPRPRHHRIMDDQTGPRKANQHFPVVLAVDRSGRQLADTRPARARLIGPLSMPAASASLTTLIGGRRPGDATSPNSTEERPARRSWRRSPPA
jgi:hypothetical protein